MIFSLGEKLSEQTFAENSGLDIVCFFHPKHSVHCSPHLWFEVMAASLRLKKNVLFLEEERELPVIDQALRWSVGENWVWLTPRSLGPLSASFRLHFHDFPTFKAYLKKNK